MKRSPSAESGRGGGGVEKSLGPPIERLEEGRSASAENGRGEGGKVWGGRGGVGPPVER